jgi:hypothetical protein
MLVTFPKQTKAMTHSHFNLRLQFQNTSPKFESRSFPKKKREGIMLVTFLKQKKCNDPLPLQLMLTTSEYQFEV